MNDTITLDEMKLAVCEKLPELIEVNKVIGSFNRGSRVGMFWVCNSGYAHREINWPTEGLQVCHEAEKLLTEKERIWYLQRLAQIRLKLGHAGTIACMLDNLAFATYEQRLEALCKVWFPERFN